MPTHKWRALSLIVFVAGACAGALDARADWRDDWAAFAAKTGEPGHKAWAEAIAQPESKKLEAAWKAFRGYDASTLLDKADVPAELKPGLVITPQNIGSMPWADKYIPGFWRTVLGNQWVGLQKIRIVPTSHYYMSAPVLAATQAVKPANLKINERGELLNADKSLFMSTTAGIPFTAPKDGLELNYAQMAHGVGTDDMHFKPITMYACTANNTAEHTYVGEIWWRKLAGRTEREPLGNVKQYSGAQEAGALFFQAPRDVRGLAGVRVRSAAVEKDDEFKVFIPTLRRTRTLTGTNGQDPLAAGLEIDWDGWRSHWSKTDATKFDYKLAGEGFILGQPAVGHFYDPLTHSQDGCTVTAVDLELRPVWILEITDKTKTYEYSKQRLYIDKELYYTVYKEMYDRTGQLLRIWTDSRDFVPQSGEAQWRNAIVANVNAKRVTLVEMKSAWERADMNNSLFDIDQLRNH